MAWCGIVLFCPRGNRRGSASFAFTPQAYGGGGDENIGFLFLYGVLWPVGIQNPPSTILTSSWSTFSIYPEIVLRNSAPASTSLPGSWVFCSSLDLVWTLPSGSAPGNSPCGWWGWVLEALGRWWVPGLCPHQSMSLLRGWWMCPTDWAPSVRGPELAFLWCLWFVDPCFKR